MSQHKTKSDQNARIHCRVSLALKSQIEEAARLTGQSLTSFTEGALSEKVQSVFEHQERIVLSQQAFEAFLQAIGAAPDNPSPKLRRAVENYRERGSQPECPT